MYQSPNFNLWSLLGIVFVEHNERKRGVANIGGLLESTVCSLKLLASRLFATFIWFAASLEGYAFATGSRLLTSI